MLVLCITESTKLIPYVVGNRKVVKAYLKTCLGLWSSPSVNSEREGDDDEAGDGADKVRIAAYLGLRRMAMAHDESLLDGVLKVRFSRCMVMKSHNLIGRLLDTRPQLQVDQCALIARYQSHEEHCYRLVQY